MSSVFRRSRPMLASPERQVHDNRHQLLWVTLRTLQQLFSQLQQQGGALALAFHRGAARAAYLDRTQTPGREYLELLRSHAAELHARGQVSGRKDTIATL
jgi:hypothetical protein